MPDLKREPNRARYIAALRRMTPEQRLAVAFELTEITRAMTRQALRRRHPSATEAELHTMFLKRLAQCHNKNY